MELIKNVAIPIDLGRTFIAPDLEKALDYYPNFISYSKSDWSFNGYLCYILKLIDRKKPNGYNGDKAFKEFLRYIGLNKYGEKYLKYINPNK